MTGPGFKLEMITEAIIRYQPSFIAMGTHHYFGLSKSQAFQKADPEKLNCVEIIWPFGAPLPESCNDIYHSKMKNLKFIMNYYGMTEMGGLAINDSSKSLGFVIPGTQIKVKR